MKVIISNTIGTEILYCGGLIAQEEPVYIIYTALANIDEPFHVTPDSLAKNIRECSKILDFKYEVIFRGRQYYGKLDSMPQIKMEKVLSRRMNFLQPTDIFIPALNHDSSNNIVNYSIKNLYSDSGINIFEYGEVTPTYYYMLSNTSIRDKNNAKDVFGKLLPYGPFDPMEYYKIHRMYNEILSGKEEQDKTGNNKDIPST